MRNELPVMADPPTVQRLAARLGVDAVELHRLASREGLDLARLLAGDIDTAEALIRYLRSTGAER